MLTILNKYCVNYLLFGDGLAMLYQIFSLILLNRLVCFWYKVNPDFRCFHIIPFSAKNIASFVPITAIAMNIAPVLILFFILFCV